MFVNRGVKHVDSEHGRLRPVAPVGTDRPPTPYKVSTLEPVETPVVTENHSPMSPTSSSSRTWWPRTSKSVSSSPHPFLPNSFCKAVDSRAPAPKSSTPLQLPSVSSPRRRAFPSKSLRPLSSLTLVTSSPLLAPQDRWSNQPPLPLDGWTLEPSSPNIF